MTPSKAKSGWLLYATIMRTLVVPKSAVEVSQKISVVTPSLRTILRRLHAQRLIRIDSWTTAGTRNRPVPRYGFGGEPDAPTPIGERTGRPIPLPPISPRPEVTALATVIRELRAEPCTAATLVDRCGINRSFVYHLLRHMHSLRLVRIADWERRLYGGTPAAAYQFAVDHEDVKRPKRIPRRVVDAKNHAARKRRSGDLQIARALAGVAFAAL